jgi:hypothetical protein
MLESSTCNLTRLQANWRFRTIEPEEHLVRLETYTIEWSKNALPFGYRAFENKSFRTRMRAARAAVRAQYDSVIPSNLFLRLMEQQQGLHRAIRWKIMPPGLGSLGRQTVQLA